MNNHLKLMILSASCFGLAACNTIDVSSPTSIHAIEHFIDNAKLAKKDGTLSVNSAGTSAALTYDGLSFTSMVKTGNSGEYSGTSGASSARLIPISVGKDSSLWKASLSDFNGSHSAVVGYVIGGTPTADLPNGKGDYFGTLNATFIDKGGDLAGKNEATSGSLKMSINFGTGGFSALSSNHSDDDFNAVAGHVEFTNGKVEAGKVTFDAKTTGGLVANLGLDGGSVSGKGEGMFYADSNTNIDKAHDLLGTGSFENNNTVGVFGFSGGYHPESTPG